MIKWSFKKLISAIKLRLQNNFDVIIAIDGFRGAGKSTLGYKICKAVKPTFSPYKDIIYKRNDLIEQLEHKFKDSILADEMINVGYKRDFYNEDQKMLNKMLNMYRDHCNLFIMCIPNFYSLDRDLQDLVSLRLTVVKRGVAIVQMPHSTMYSNDKWDTLNNQKIERKYLNQLKPRYSKLTTYRGIICYSDLTPKQKRIYQKVKDMKRTQFLIENKYIQGSTNETNGEMDNLVFKLESGDFIKDDLRKFASVKGISYTKLKNQLNAYLSENKKPYNVDELLIRAVKLNSKNKKIKQLSVRI